MPKKRELIDDEDDVPSSTGKLFGEEEAPAGQTGAEGKGDQDIYNQTNANPKTDKGKQVRRKSKSKSKIDFSDYSHKNTISDDEGFEDKTPNDLVETPEKPEDRFIGRMGYATMDEIEDYFGKVKWAWKGYIPIGHVSMLAGVQGQGKSYFAARIMATLCGAQKEWPNGDNYSGVTGPIILIDTEQMRGEYVTRLKKMGVKGGDVFFPKRKEDEEDDPTYTVVLLEDIQAIEESAVGKKCVCIVVDSLTGAHDLNENSSEMKRILKPLSDMAARLQIPIIVVHDLRKKDIRESSW